MSGLLGFRKGTILASVHDVGILCIIENFNMFVKAALIVCLDA